MWLLQQKLQTGTFNDKFLPDYVYTIKGCCKKQFQQLKVIGEQDCVPALLS